MSRSLVLAICSALSCPAFGQVPVLAPDPVLERGAMIDRTQWITLQAMGDQNATAIRNEMMLGLWLGRDLDRPLRERSWGTSQFGNRFGYELKGGLSWTGERLGGPEGNWRPTVGLEHTEVLGVRYSRDLYALTFFGNADYAERTADLSSSAHENIRYQSFYAGLVDHRNGRSLRVALVKGQFLNASDIDQASLYTAADGRTLDVDLNARYWQSDTAQLGLSAWNGTGMSVSGSWSWQFASEPGPLWLMASVTDLGVVRWNERSLRVDQDTTVSYNGITVADVFDLDAVVLGEAQLLDTFGIRPSHAAFTRVLPFRASLALCTSPEERWQGGLRIDQQYLPGYAPQLTFTMARRMGQMARLSANAASGGTGGWRFGVAGRMSVGTNFSADLSISQVSGLMNDRVRGLGAALRVQMGF
jgi:hypothetical protein